MNYKMFDEIDYFTNLKNNLDLFSPYEGYSLGNLFKNLYRGYKNYQPAKLKVLNEQMEMLLNINQMSFVVLELNLYLDNYPNDKEALSLFKKYQKIMDDLKKDYERRYGPLSTSGSINSNDTFLWESTKWPFDR